MLIIVLANYSTPVQSINPAYAILFFPPVPQPHYMNDNEADSIEYPLQKSSVEEGFEVSYAIVFPIIKDSLCYVTC